MSDAVLDSDNGIIAIALKVYIDLIESEGGDIALYERAIELYLKYRDLPERNT